MSFGYYIVLDVPEDASEDQIKRAYFKKMREHPPETDAEGFKQIREAYETLRDDRARASHDALHQHGEQINALMKQANTLQEDEKWADAIPLLKRVLVLWPEADMARNQLGLCYLYIGNHRDACRVFYGLIQRNKDVPVFWINYGHSFVEIAESLANNDDGEQNTRYEKARLCFQKAIALEPHNSDPYLYIAKTYRAQGDHEKSYEWAEKAVMADGNVNMGDLDAFMFMVVTCALTKRHERIRSIASEILKIVPDDADARQYVAFRFASLAFELFKIKADPDLIILFLDQALRFNTDDKLTGFRESMRHISAAGKKMDAFINDSAIIHPLKAIGAILFDAAFSSEDDGETEERKLSLDQAFTALEQYKCANVSVSVDYLRTHYSAIYYLNTELFDNIRKVASASLYTNTSSPGPSVQNQGCLVVIALMAVALYGAVTLMA